MKILLLLLFMILSSGFLRAQSNQKIIYQFFTALNNHDTAALAQLFADSARGESPNWNEAQVGSEAIAHEYARNFESDPVIQYTITNIVEGKNAIVVEYTSSGTMTTLEAGVPAYMQGKSYSLRNCSRFNIANSKITYLATYFDQVSFLRQMGFFEKH